MNMSEDHKSIDWIKKLNWDHLYTHALIERGCILIASGHYKEAQIIFDIAHILYPNNADYCSMLGNICMRLNNISEAARLFKKTLMLNPTDNLAKINYIRAKLALQDIDIAQQFAAEALTHATNTTEKEFLDGIMQIITYMNLPYSNEINAIIKGDLSSNMLSENEENL